MTLPLNVGFPLIEQLLKGGRFCLISWENNYGGMWSLLGPGANRTSNLAEMLDAPGTGYETALDFFGSSVWFPACTAVTLLESLAALEKLLQKLPAREVLSECSDWSCLVLTAYEDLLIDGPAEKKVFTDQLPRTLEEAVAAWRNKGSPIY